jgi:hypothetical protein
MASKFGDFLAAYTNQIGARNTADYNRAKADQARMDVNKNKISDTISELHNNEKIFDSSGRLNKITGLAAMHDPNIASQYVNFLNTASVANQFKDQFGTKQRGTLLAPTKNKEGTYTFNIRDHRGKIKPVTGRRSGDPDDAPVTLTKEELVAFYEAQSENLLQKGGLTGRAVGKTIGNQLDTQFDQAYGAAGKLLGDENVDDPEQTSNGMGEIIQIINKNRPPEEKEAIANMDDGLEAEDITGAAAARETVSKEGEGNQSFFPAEPEKKDYTKGDYGDPEITKAAEMAVKQQADPSILLSKNEIDTLAKAMPQGKRAAFINNFTSNQASLEANQKQILDLEAKDSLSPSEEKELARLKTRQEKYILPFSKKQLDKVIPELEKTETTNKRKKEQVKNAIDAKKRQLNNPKLSPERKEEVQKELDTLQQELGVGPTESELAIANLPDLPDTNNMDDARSWFTNNQETLKNLPQEDYNKIQTFLQEKNINSADDMAKAVREGALQRKDALKAAALIAFTVNAGATGDQAAIGRQQSMFGTLANTFLQGDPSVDSNMAANTQSLLASRQQSAALAQSKFLQSGMQQYADAAKKATDLLINDKGEFLDLRDENAPGVAQAKKAMRNFFLDINSNKAFGTANSANPAVSHMMGEILLSLGSQGSVGFMDWFGDFPAGDTVIPAAGEVMNRIRRRTNSKGDVELVFVNASEPGAETEFSVLPDEFLALVGTPSYNFTRTQVPDLVKEATEATES